MRSHLQFAIETFGPARCMVGSDWPCSTQQLYGDHSYDAWFALVLDGTGLSPAERTEVASSSARRFYSLDDPAG